MVSQPICEWWSIKQSKYRKSKLTSVFCYRLRICIQMMEVLDNRVVFQVQFEYSNKITSALALNCEYCYKMYGQVVFNCQIVLVSKCISLFWLFLQNQKVQWDPEEKLGAAKFFAWTIMVTGMRRKIKTRNKTHKHTKRNLNIYKQILDILGMTFPFDINISRELLVILSLILGDHSVWHCERSCRVVLSLVIS